MAAAVNEPRRALASLPGWFEPNAGQYPRHVRYFSRGAAGTLLVESGAATFASQGRSLRLEWHGALAAGQPTGASPLAARSAYFTGAPEQWKRDVPHYATVRAQQLYQGIDLVYYVAGKQVEFDLVVAPGADPSPIAFSFPGAGAPVISEEGDLVFSNGMRQRVPIAYQEIEGKRKPVEARYQIAANGRVGFTLGQYDNRRPLTIDPILYAGYLGGDQSEAANAIAVDRQGNVWVAGSSSSTITLPEQYAPIQDAPAGAKDAFLAKLTPDASGKLVLTYWTQLGGTSDDEATAVTVDNQGFVFIAGNTASSDFPRAGATVQDTFGGETDAFAAKIRIEDSGSAALWFSQFYGGEGTEAANAIALDNSGAIYIGGFSNSDAVPGASSVGLQCCNRGGYEGFMAKFSPDSSPSLAYGTYLGGSSTDVIRAIAVDPDGNVLVAGYTASNDFPVAGAPFQGELRSGTDAFLVKIDLSRPLLDALVYGTYLGGGALDMARSLAIAPDGDVWIGGYTQSQDFPITPDAYNTGNAGEIDAFLTKFRINSPDPRQSLIYSTYFGGRGTDILYSIAAGPGGLVALGGYTYSDDFPLIESGTAARALRGSELFLAQLDTAQPGRQAIRYSTVISGNNMDAVTGVAVDAAGKLYAAGFTQSVDIPVTDGSSKVSSGGLTQSFVLEATSPRVEE
jgi:hypothetical protein